MDKLNDDELLIIFKMLSLNERANLRLVSKRFKSLLDTIQITKLIIYERIPSLPGRLVHTNEPYGIQHTVYVYDLNKFFNNPTIIGQMKSIRQLVVEGFKPKTEIDLKTGFKKLNYLKLRNVVFTNASLLQSTELEHLIIKFSFFNSIERCTSHLDKLDGIKYNNSPSVFNYQFNELKTRKLKYLKLMAAEFEFLDYCVKHGLFSSLEEIDVSFSDFASLTFLNNRCPTLKTVNCQIGLNFESFFLDVDKIENVSEQLRDDLSVYLFGIRFNKANAMRIVDFIIQFGHCLKNNYADLEYHLAKDTHKHIKRYERDYDLRFHQLVRTIYIQCLIKDVNFFNKFNQCEALFFLLVESPKFYFKSADLFSKVEHMGFITIEGGSTYGNEIFDLLPKYCAHLANLTIQNTNKINFKFICSLVRLKIMNLKLCCPIKQSEFMQMIRTLKHLIFADICYVVESTNSMKEELSKFKREVNDCLVNELRRPSIELKIEIHKKQDVGHFIRYILREKDCKESFLMDDESESSMFQMCQYASMDHRFN